METLIALVIVGAAGAAILGKTRTLLDYNRRIRTHQDEASALLNQTAWFQASINDKVQIDVKPPQLIVRGRTGGMGPPLARVENFSPQSGPLPPIDQAYTPFQRYALEHGAHQLSLILPSLPPPVSATRK